MSNTEVAIDAVNKLFEITEQRDELLEALEKTQEFLQFLWRDVHMNDYAFEYLEKIQGVVLEATTKANEGK